MRKFIVFVLVTIISLMAFSVPGQKVVAEEGGLPVIRVGHVGHDHQIALFIAALEGEKYKKYGAWLKEKKAKEIYDLMEGDKAIAELHLAKVGGGSMMPAAMERGEIQIGFGGVAAVAFFRDKGNKFKIISPLQTQGDMLVVKPDLPITDWASFIKHVNATDKPLKIGYKAPVAVAKLIFMTALDEEGISYSTSDKKSETAKVELVNLSGGKNMIPSLASGAVDGFVMNQPEVSLAKVKKVGKVIADMANLPPKGRWIDHPCCCVCTTEDTLANHRDVLRDLMLLVLAATENINTDKAHAAELTSKWTKLPLEVEQDSLPSIIYMARFKESWKRGMMVWKKIMNDLGTLKKDLKDKTDDEFWKILIDESVMAEAEKIYVANTRKEEEKK